MYIPPAFALTDPAEIAAALAAAPLANLVTATARGLIATALPLFHVAGEGEYGTLYGHLAKANPHWREAPSGESLAIFMGPDAYVSPGWYATKQTTHKVVPTWNYASVHAYGPVEFFEDAGRLHDVVSRLTTLHEQGRDRPWAVSDAPADYVASQLKGIVGLRMPLTRLEAKRKMSQNRPAEDRQGVRDGLTAQGDSQSLTVARLIP